jgi:hypothetical protein
MTGNSFLQKVCLTVFWGFCAACVIQFYATMVWKANEDINGADAMKELYGNAKQVAHPVRSHY